MPRRNSLSGLQGEWCLGAGFVALDVVRSINGHATERRYAGGSCGNVIAILSFLGWKSALFARIGYDLPGSELLKDLEHWSVDTHYLVREVGRQTPVVFQEIVSDKSGLAHHHFSRICPACGSRTAGYRPLLQKGIENLVTSMPPSSVFYFDRVARSNVEMAVRAREGGALIVFEPSGVKDPALFSSCLRICHVFKYSHERLRGVRQAAAEAEVPVEIETRGSAGLRVAVRRGPAIVYEGNLPAFRAPRHRDAAGSGDWCSAGLIHALLAGRRRVPNLAKSNKALIEALRWGQALAALNCAYEGARGLMYAMPKEITMEAVAGIIKGKDVSALVEMNLSPGRRGGKRSGRCIACDRKLQG